MSNATSRRQRGFTFVELIVAILVFAIGILGLAKMQILAVRGNSYSMEMARAANVAEDQVENLMSRDIDDPLLGGKSPDTGTQELFFTLVTDGDAPKLYDHESLPKTSAPEVSWRVQANVPQNGLKTVNLQSGWMDADHSPHWVDFTFVVGDNL